MHTHGTKIMTTSESSNLAQTVDELVRLGHQQIRSVARVRLVGYGLLVFAFMDILYLLIPPNLLNPVWEFQTIGNLVERVPVPLLGMALVFWGGNYERSNLGQLLVKILSWLCLLLAVLFFLIAPLTIVNTFRINDLNNQQIEEQAGQRQQQLVEVETQIQQGTTQNLQTVAAELQRLGVAEENIPQDPEQLRNEILTRVSSAKEELGSQVQDIKAQQKFNLLKNAGKFMVGSVISGVLFVLMWKTTRWAR